MHGNALQIFLCVAHAKFNMISKFDHEAAIVHRYTEIIGKFEHNVEKISGPKLTKGVSD